MWRVKCLWDPMLAIRPFYKWMDHEFEMMATNLSPNYELTIRSSMTASVVVLGSFNLAFFSRHHHDHPGLWCPLYCCSNCLHFNLTCHHQSLCNRIQDTCHCYHHHSCVTCYDVTRVPSPDVTKCWDNCYIVSQWEVMVTDSKGWVKWVTRGVWWPHCLLTWLCCGLGALCRCRRSRRRCHSHCSRTSVSGLNIIIIMVTSVIITGHCTELSGVMLVMRRLLRHWASSAPEQSPALGLMLVTFSARDQY